MDINTLASEIINSHNKKTAKELLPKQQKTRSYKSIEKSTNIVKIDPTLLRQFVGESRGEWIIQYNLQWPMGPMGKVSRNNATQKELEDYAKEWASNRSFSHMGDDKYIKIKKVTKQTIIYMFDIDRWIKDNFNSVTPRFKAPTSLLFQYKKDPPTFFTTNAPYMDLERFIGNQFKYFLKNKANKLKHREFAFIKKMSADLFEYEMDMQHGSIKATLKYSVIMASLAGYMMYKNKKQFNKKELTVIKRKTRNLGSTKRLDRYLKGL